MDIQHQKPQYLTVQQADQRYQQIKQQSIRYNLIVKLEKGQNCDGILICEFQLHHNQLDLIMDFSGTQVSTLYINDEQFINPETIYDGLFIHFPSKYLKAGHNVVKMYYKNKYVNDGLGLHSFIENDGKQYLYTQFEAYYCHRMFPCFDQPDLKAILQLTCISPNEWVVLSNEVCSSQQKFNKNLKELQICQQIKDSVTLLQGIDEQDNQIVVFPDTKLLPTYLFGVIAGPYKEIKCANPYKQMPMSIFCRESLFEHMKRLADFMFEVTIEGMKIYENFFGYKYPFNKYDQIFVPEFNAGAMENAGLVTFNDDYVFREQVDMNRLTRFANTVTHELSHHWFGDLVTMKWWNDLWLNESFADFISHYCLSKMDPKTQKISNIWAQFNLKKSWGYRADQLQTTHPISGDVPNTEAAESIFDGITYAKGAATLRQLMSLVGEQAFGDAMKKYFCRHAFQNATLNDFIKCMQEQFEKKNVGFTLQQWQQQWICTAGLNECQPIFNPQDRSKTAKLILRQTPALYNHATLRYHKMKVALFDKNSQIHVIEVLLQPQLETVIEYDGSLNEYQAVLVNYGDETFIKILLDEVSLDFFKNNLHKVTDLLSRTLIWRAFFDMVRDGKISSEEYFDIFANAFPNETSDQIISNQLIFAHGAFANFTPMQYKSAMSEKMFNFLINYLCTIPQENKNLIVGVKSKILGFAWTDKQIERLIQWYNGTEESLKKFDLGLSNSWEVILLVHRSRGFTREQKQQLFAQQAMKDPSDTKTYKEFTCKALDATNEEREKMWEQYIQKDSSLSVRTLENSMEGFNNPFCLQEIEQYQEKWFSNLEQIFENKSKAGSEAFFDYLFPLTQNYEQLEQSLIKFEATISEKQVLLKKNLRESIDDVKRKRRCYETFYKRAKCAQNK